MIEYRLTPAAERDLEAIWEYTALEWGEAQAERYIAAMVVAFEEFAQSPKSATPCDHIRPGYRRRGVDHHVVYFRTTAYGIAVIRVLHARMDAARHI